MSDHWTGFDPVYAAFNLEHISEDDRRSVTEALAAVRRETAMRCAEIARGRIQRLERFLCDLADNDNDPTETIADNGMTVWDGVRGEANALVLPSACAQFDDDLTKEFGPWNVV